MRATKKQLAGIVAATTVGAFVAYRLRGWTGGDEIPEVDGEDEAEASPA